MIDIHRSHTVIPSEPTPTSTLSLSLCDQIKLPNNHASQLYLYTTNHDSSLNSSIHILTTSLSKALTHYYPFAGRLRSIQGGRYELLCNAKGAHLLEATCQVSFDYSVDFGSIVEQQLVPKIDYDDVPIDDVPLLVVQLTWFPCGTLTLGLSLCRALVDGASVGNFMNSWAKIARGESLDSSLIPFLDRTLLDSQRLHIPPRFQHPEFSPPPLWEEGNNNKLQVRKPLYATAFLKLTKHQVEKLKNKNNVNKMPSYTSFEVISGHLWKCVCKVRYEGNGNQPTRLTTSVNCRNRLSPPLPRNYFGNATFPTVTPTCSFDDVVHKPLEYVAGKVREAIERMNDEYVRSALDYIANQKDMNLLRDTFYNFARRKGQRGESNLYVVGWTNFPFYETDFGWGKPECMVPGTGNIDFDGKAFILDSGDGDAFVVAVCLQPLHTDALKKLFYEDIVSTTSKL